MTKDDLKWALVIGLIIALIVGVILGKYLI